MGDKVKVTPALRFLGLTVKDKITGFSGVVTSVGFDIFGCSLALVAPDVKAGHASREMVWFHTSQLTVIETGPVISVPEFDFSDALALTGTDLHSKGPENKPTSQRI